MSDLIKTVEVFAPIFEAETPIFDSSMVMKRGGSNIVRVITEGGVEGYGMTFGEPVAQYVNETLRGEVIGCDPLANEDIWNRMLLSIRSSGRKGVALLGMSAIDIAIWDIKGKLLGLPIYRLLGGTKRLIPAYASVGFLSMPDDECAEQSIACVADGYKTIKIKIGYDAGNNIKADAERVAKVRRAIGDSADIIVDANGIYDAATAIRFCDRIAELDVCLFEEPTHADDIPGLRRVREAVKIPIATGENEYTKYGMRDLVLANAVDVVQFDITRAGGFTEMAKISAITQAWNLKLAPHFWPQFSAHLLSPAPHGLYLETFASVKGANPGGEIILDQPPVVNGFYEIPEKPGLGLTFNSDYLEKYKIV